MHLDLTFTSAQLRILRKLQADQLALYPDGKVRLRRTDEVVPRGLVRALVSRQWVREPGYPLFDGSEAGAITDRGIEALRRNAA